MRRISCRSPLSSLGLRARGRATLRLLLVLLPLACADNSATDPGPGTTGAATLEMSLPPVVEEGAAFPLTVNALAADGMTPDASFRGMVTLSASAGSVSPASVELIGGTATANVTLAGHAGDVHITARSGSTEASSPTTVLGHDAVTRLAIVPGALLLTAAGASQVMDVRAYDESGRRVVADVLWSSSDDGVVSVTTDGVATAVAALGSAQITAAAGGIVSAPALAVIARPAEDATLVADAQLVGEPVPVDASAAYGLGWQYRVTLSGVAAPDVGSILLGTGEAPVGGRVVAVAQSGDEVVVTLEVVPLEEMFSELVLHESIDLSRAELSVPAETRQYFDVQQRSGGALEFRQRSAGTIGARRSTGGMPGVSTMGALQSASLSDLEFTLGPFKCRIEATVAPLQVTGTATFTITPDLTFTLDYDSHAGGLQKLALSGEVQAQVKVAPRLETSFESKVDCGAKLAQIALPIGGPVALIFGGQVPLGVGFEVNGKTTLANVGLAFEVEAQASTEVGIDCTTGACEMINTFDSSADGTFEPLVPDPTEDFKVELRIFPYGYARLTFGNPFVTALQFETFDIRAGLAQLLDLAPTSVQIGNTGYASNFRLSIFGQAKAGSKIDDFLTMLRLSLVKVEARVEVPIAESPRGTLTISPASVRPGTDSDLGEPATFTVTLDPVSYLGFDAVESVELLWRKDDGDGGHSLEPGRPGCTSMSAAPGQNVFTCEAYFLEEHEGEQTFYALVNARLFGQPLPVPLEIGSDGQASLTVGGIVGITIAPAEDTLFTGETGQFTASVTGAMDTTVVWSASGGTITADGRYTAGDVPGVYQVTAHSAADSTVSASATVLVKQAPQFVPDLLAASVCGGSVLDSVDDLPFAISGGFTHPDYPGVTCSASASLAVTPFADGTILIEGAVESVATRTQDGAGWVLNFQVTGEYRYEFDAQIGNGDPGVGVGVLWRGGGYFVPPPAETTVLTCVGAGGYGFTGYGQCPQEQDVVSGTLGEGRYGIRASAYGQVALTFKLTLIPVP